jgi:dihydrofolate synthase/folylpolyglutamate synthase
MTRYEQALAVLGEALLFGIEPSLVTIEALVRRLGNPQNSFASIQIAGTNGKTSTSRFTAAFLQAHGKKVGLYTSPELVEYPERIEINGQVVSHEDFAEAIHAARDGASMAISAGEFKIVTEFELLTAAAFWLFAREQVDFAVLEVGMGGRWDATSVVNPQVAVITGINLDHTDVLGDTIEKIAAEKAAIIKPGSVAILGPGTIDCREVFLARCAEVKVAPILVSPDDPLPSPLNRQRFPRYQERNISCALAAAKVALGAFLDLPSIQTALDTLSIPGRFEVLREQPLLLIDASHNPESARVLAFALNEAYAFDPQTQTSTPIDTLLLGILNNKDATGIIRALTPLFRKIVVTQSNSPRAIPATELAELVAKVDGRKPEVFPTVSAALEALTARGADIVATGSITLAGEVKAEFKPV